MESRLAREAATQPLLESGPVATPPVLPNYGTRDAMLARLRDLQPALEAQGVRHALIFGSIARGDDVPKSDIDIILDLDPHRQIGLFAFAGIAEFLESELGRSVDLGTMCSLRRPRHNDILDEMVRAF